MTNQTDRLEAAVYNALRDFQQTADWPQLRLAQMRHHLAEHIARDLTLTPGALPAAPDGISARDLAHALDNSTPYPIELTSTVARFMAERLLEMLTINKRDEHPVWQPEEQSEPGPQPQPEDLATLSDAVPVAVSAVVEPPADQTAVTPPPALTEEGRLRARVQVLEEDAERAKGLAKVGARCMREGHQGLIESGRVTVEGHRFALSVALGLGTGASWDAIHERVKVLPAPADRAAIEDRTERLAQWLWDNCGEDERSGLLTDDPRRIAAVALRWPGLRRMADETATTERPACPHCGLPHDLTPSMELACASIRASIRDRDAADDGPAAGARQDGADRG